MADSSFILTLTSAPLPGIIAAVSAAIARLDGNIVETHQYWDREAGRFFLRMAFVGPSNLSVPVVDQMLKPAVAEFGLEFQVTDASLRPRIIVMVSKFDHALLHLLYQIRVGWLQA